MLGTICSRTRIVIVFESILLILMVSVSAFAQMNLVRQHNGSANLVRLGWHVAGAGYIDGDAVPDYIVGMPYASPGGLANAGTAYVYSGATGNVIYQKDGGAASARFGVNVAGVGDINGDGRGDFAISDVGTTRIYSGKDGSLLYSKSGDVVGRAGDLNGDGRIDFIVGNEVQIMAYSGATGSLLWYKPGIVFDGLGDIDGDGKADVVVGNQNASPGGLTSAGSVYVYSGATGSLLYQRDGTQFGGKFGSSVAGIGDLNGDGRADFVAGADGEAAGSATAAGGVYICSGANGTVLTHISGQASEQLGVAVAGPGDVNGDGKPDYMAGSIYASPGGLTQAGSAYLYSGANGAVIGRVNGSAANDNLGFTLDGVGDVNGDGRPDVIIGAPLADPAPYSAAGSAYVYSLGGTSCSVVAQFSATPATGTAPLNVTFTNQSTGSPTGWSWSFGDGATSTVQSPSHTYSAAGTYTVTLTASAGSCSNSKSSIITVSAPACALAASFSASPISATTGQTVTFTDKSTGSPTAWSWSFGDGTTSTLQNPTHIYSAAGTFTVTEIISAGSCKDTATGTITVTAPTCAVVAQFSASPTSGLAPLAVVFTNQSTGSPTSWSWNFGDGTSSTLQSPSHTYSAAGTYSVTMTATSATCSNTITKTNYIVVSAPSVSLQVASVSVLEELVSRKFRGKATVLVVDASNRPVSGATVSGKFNVPNTNVKTATTDANGQAIIYSDNAKKTQTFCFTVTNVTKVNYTYAVVGAAPSACEYAVIANREIQGSQIDGLPGETSLAQNYPNPFNPRTEISYSLPAASHVSLEIYNVIGARVATLVDRTEEAGSHTVSWDASGNASGVYFYRMTADGFSVTKKMLLLK